MFCLNVPLNEFYYLKLIWSHLIKFEPRYGKKSDTVKNGVWNQRVPPLVFDFFDVWPKIIRSVLIFIWNPFRFRISVWFWIEWYIICSKKNFRQKNQRGDPWKFCKTNPVLGYGSWLPTYLVLILFLYYSTLRALLFKWYLEWIDYVLAKL